ncbi:hypothetical protein SDC9_155306 [bioreactor metagenome]|uniref:Uncharacterized protein n=1 Tax=bioreactor metagenome TaxID=1076179 RepID=A0A645F2I2_9ZZZZ
MRVHDQESGVLRILEVFLAVGDVFLRNVDAGHAFDAGRDLSHDPAVSGRDLKDAVALLQTAPHEVYLSLQVFGDARQLRLVYLAQPLRVESLRIIV